jgi:hypothetical protein
MAATGVAVAACAWASGAVVAGGDDRLCAGIADASGPISLPRAPCAHECRTLLKLLIDGYNL